VLKGAFDLGTTTFAAIRHRILIAGEQDGRNGNNGHLSTAIGARNRRRWCLMRRRRTHGTYSARQHRYLPRNRRTSRFLNGPRQSAKVCNYDPETPLPRAVINEASIVAVGTRNPSRQTRRQLAQTPVASAWDATGPGRNPEVTGSSRSDGSAARRFLIWINQLTPDDAIVHAPTDAREVPHEREYVIQNTWLSAQ